MAISNAVRGCLNSLSPTGSSLGYTTKTRPLYRQTIDGGAVMRAYLYKLTVDDGGAPCLVRTVAVLKTAMGATSSWVRIPLPPPVLGVKKAPQTEICGASFLAKSSNVDQRVWVTSTFLALYPLMVGNPILRPIPVLGLPRISLTSIPLPQSLFRTAQRCHCCPRATVCTTVHSTQFLRL